MNVTVTNNATTVDREGDCEIVVRRRFAAPARLVFAAWTTPELFAKWWTPASFGITVVSREMDIRTGGSYRLTMKHPSAPSPMTFFGRYLEVTPHSRVVWTNEEAGEAGQVTTVTFEEQGGGTLVVVRERYPSKAALDEAVASGAMGAFEEQFAQLDRVLAE